MRPQDPVASDALAMSVLPCGSFSAATYAKDQPEYLPLPVLRVHGPEGRVVSRWRLSWRERLIILLTGDLYLSQLTFNSKLQPIKPTISFTESVA